MVVIGNFDGVHRGHQAMLALLATEARQRDLSTCVLTFEPHPRDYFAGIARKPELAPARIGTLRDKLAQLAAAGVDQTIVLPFDAVPDFIVGFGFGATVGAADVDASKL